MSGPPIRVLLVDDDPMVCAGLELLIDQADDIEVVGSVDDGDRVVDAVHAHHPDVVLLDVRMRRQDGITTTAELQRLPSRPRILVLTTWDADDVVDRAIHAGADGFLLKTSGPTTILSSIRDVAGGRGVLEPDKVQYVFGRLNEHAGQQRDAAEAVDTLTPREREVAVGVAQGLSNADIGRRIFASEATVKTHLAAAQRKLGVANRVGVAVAVTKAGLV